MKIVNLETFRSLPAGTIYSKYKPCIFDGLMIKGETWEADFRYQDLIGNIENMADYDFFDKCDEMETDDKFSVPLDFDCMTRDGLQEKEQLFAIYEKEDVKALIIRLQKALEAY